MISFAMKALAACAVTVVVVSAAVAGPVETLSWNNFDSAPPENGPGYLFVYESLVRSPGTDGGTTYTDWYYDYYLENNSTDHAIVSWRWEYYGYSGRIMPNPHPANTGNLIFPWPLPPSEGPSFFDTSWREDSFDDPSGWFEVTSILEWDDGTTAEIPAYIQRSLVPEPGTLSVLAGGLLGLLAAARRRRV